jgi:hypothetical protein
VLWRYDAEHGTWTEVAGATVPGGETHSCEVSDLAAVPYTGGFWAVGSYELVVGPGSVATHEFIQRSR